MTNVKIDRSGSSRLAIKISLFLWLFLSLSLTSKADLVPACLRYYFSEPEFTQAMEVGETTDVQTVIVLGEVQASPGTKGKQYLVEKIEGLPWWTTFAPTKVDTLGDIRTFIAMTKQLTARFFGFDFISLTRLLIPGPERFNWAIKLFNRWVEKKDQIPVRFYNAGEKLVHPRIYLQRFIDNFELPFSTDLTTILHEASFHTGVIFYPRDVLEQARLQAKFSLKFVDYLSDSQAITNPEVRARLTQMLMKLIVSSIDAGNGNLGFTLRMEDAGGFKFLKTLLSFVAGGASPSFRIKSLVQLVSNEPSFKLDETSKSELDHAMTSFRELLRNEGLEKEYDFALIGNMTEFEALEARIRARPGFIQSVVEKMSRNPRYRR